MAERVPGAGNTSNDETIAQLTQDKLKLKKKVHELHVENTVLKQQCSQLSAFLDVAVRKLESLGVATVAPYNVSENVRRVREMREREMQRLSYAVDEQKRQTESDVNAQTKANKSTQKFRQIYEIKEHSGAVLCAKFSPDGRLLATGSFDKTLVYWNVSEATAVNRSAEHEQSVCDVSWSNDSKFLLSAGFDGTCLYHDVEKNTVVYEFVAKGLLQTCTTVKSEPSLYLCSDTQDLMYLVDTRMPDGKNAVARSIHTKARVGAITVDSLARVLTGDITGSVKVWDLRALYAPVDTTAPLKEMDDDSPSFVPSMQRKSGSWKPVTWEETQAQKLVQHEWRNDEAASPIHSVSFMHAKDEARMLAITSDDSLLRVYDPSPFVSSSSGDVGWRLRGVHIGAKMRGHPIRCSFWSGGSQSYDDDVESAATTKLLHDSTLVAVGSADYRALIYDVSMKSGTNDMGEGQTPSLTPLQQLEGHKDVVYGATFHPIEPFIASYSADNTVKMWHPSRM